jgi:hypothetical protein
LRWESTIPVQVATLLIEALRLPLAGQPDRLEIALANAVIEFAAVPGRDRAAGDDRLRVVDAAPGDDSNGSPSTGLRLAAVGIATVDMERFAADEGWGIEPLAPDRVLGASAARVVGHPFILLEPNTEGRVAASLARSGEGPAAVYLSASDDRGPDAVRAALQDRGVSMTPVHDGPLGRQFAIAAGPAWGPHVVVCQSAEAVAGTIAP